MYLKLRPFGAIGHSSYPAKATEDTLGRCRFYDAQWICPQILGCRLSAAVNMQFFVDVHQMGSHRGGADVEACRNLLIGAALRDERQNLHLTARKLIRTFGSGNFRLPGECTDDHTRN